MAGFRVFLLEDEAWISMMMEDMLADLGYVVLGVEANLSQALARVDEVIAHADGAILDVNLGGCDYSYPFADAMIEGGVPFLFMTGYAAGFLEPRFRQMTVLPKPVQPAVLAAALAALPPRHARPGEA
jgi:CheY-like chemotaxis protein